MSTPVPPEIAITETKNWVRDVIVGWNFCPFAKSVFYDHRLRYSVASSSDVAEIVAAVVEECRFLDSHPEVETTLILVPHAVPVFLDYLDLVDLVEQTLRTLNYDGVYQVATFHPDYLFAGAELEDPANYTNRSPHPILHLLRESALTEVIDASPDDVDAIPEINVRNARRLGLERMRQMLENSRT